jgi:hypothetical protein
MNQRSNAHRLDSSGDLSDNSNAKRKLLDNFVQTAFQGVAALIFFRSGRVLIARLEET